MSKLFKFRRVRKLVRDFLCALVVSSALIVGMSPSAHQAAPIPVLSLFTTAASLASESNPAPAVKDAASRSLAAQFPDDKLSLPTAPLSTSDMALISTVLAIMFSAMMTFNLALLRHLRRVNDSPRRSVGAEG